MREADPFLDLVHRLMPALLDGPNAELTVLLDQWKRAQIRITADTNWGFYADFDVPSGATLIDAPDFVSGDATIQVEGVTNNAGCALFVRNGTVAFLEVYTFDEPWEPPPIFGAITDIRPVVLGENPPAAVDTRSANSP